MTSPPANTPLIYVVAIEPSGHAIAASIMAGLTAQAPVRFAGVGGGAMLERGLEASLFDPQDLALVGIMEALPKAPLVFRRVRDVLEDIEARQPDLLLTVDSWGFTGRLHRTLARRKSPVRRVRAVAPQVWGWRPGRAKQLALWLDLLLVLFPFEPPLFERHGLKTVHIGHPVVELPGLAAGDGQAFRARHGLPTDAPVLGVLPGSRSAELRRLLPVFLPAARDLAEQVPGLRLVVPTLPQFHARVQAAVAQAGLDGALVLSSPEDRAGAFPAMTAAMAASGTVTLELARAGVPHVIGYRVNEVTATLFRALTTLTHVNLVNILTGGEVVPELLQRRCTPQQVAQAVAPLLVSDSPARQVQKGAFAAVCKELAPPAGAASPGEAAARAVLDLLATGPAEA